MLNLSDRIKIFLSPHNLHIYPSDDMSPDFNKSLHIASNSVGGTVNPKLPSDDGIFKSAAFDN